MGPLAWEEAALMAVGEAGSAVAVLELVPLKLVAIARRRGRQEAEEAGQATQPRMFPCTSTHRETRGARCMAYSS